MPVLLHLVLVQSDKLEMEKEDFQPLSEEKAEWTQKLDYDSLHHKMYSEV